MEHPVLSAFEATMKRNILRYHVGQVMFCPTCRNIMDARRAVEVDLMRGPELLSSVVACAPCADKQVDAVRKMAEKHGYTLTVNDGRKLFARPARKANKVVEA